MKEKLKVGFITTVSGRWPRELPRQRKAKYDEYLKNAYPEYDFCFPDDIAEDKASLDAAIAKFKSFGVDVVLLMYGAFSGDDYACGLYDELKTPIIFWSLREPELHGGRLLANALVAATMNSASVKRLGGTTHFVLGNEDEPEAKKELDSILSAYALKKAMSKVTFGLLGYRPTAFYNSAFNEGLIRRTFGIKMEETDLKVVFDKMAKYTEEEVNAEIAKITIPVVKNLPEGHLENHARLCMAIREVFAEQGYDYAALKCWPEMGNLHATPCAVIGRLADEGIHLICEGDVDAGLAYAAENILSKKPGFITDLININEEENYVTFWHCGNAAPSLISENCKPEMANHPLAGQGTAIRAILKGGTITFARFCDIDGKYVLFVGKGEGVDSDMYTPGAMINVKLSCPVKKTIYEIIEKGIPHHYALAWGDYVEELKAYAKLIGAEIIEAK